MRWFRRIVGDLQGLHVCENVQQKVLRRGEQFRKVQVTVRGIKNQNMKLLTCYTEREAKREEKEETGKEGKARKKESRKSGQESG